MSNWKRKQAMFKGIKFMLSSKLAFAKQNTEGIKGILYNTVWTFLRMFLRNMNFMLVYGVFQLLSLLKICMYPPSGEKKKKKWKYNTTCKDNKQRKSKKENKFRLKLKKIGKTTRPFRYDLNWIPYDYTVEVTNRFKELYLIECLVNYEWMFMTLYRRQGSRPSPRQRNAKKQSGKKRSEKQRRKRKIPIWVQSSKN